LGKKKVSKGKRRFLGRKEEGEDEIREAWGVDKGQEEG
jgi:hypothetical protein